jgi:hypothetical protein
MMAMLTALAMLILLPIVLPFLLIGLVLRLVFLPLKLLSFAVRVVFKVVGLAAAIVFAVLGVGLGLLVVAAFAIVLPLLPLLLIAAGIWLVARAIRPQPAVLAVARRA